MNRRRLLLGGSILGAALAGLILVFQRATPTNAHSPNRPITYLDDIRPLLQAHCATCHRPGQAGPFPLLTYDDAAPRADLIRRVTETRRMPPWPADTSYTSFIGENVLSTEEVAVIARWAAAGAPRGEGEEPEPRPMPHRSMLGEPDLVVTMPGRFPIPGDSNDTFAVIKMPYEVPQDTFVHAIEFVPDNRRLIHHMNAHLITYEEGRKTDVHEGQWYVVNSAEKPEQLSDLRLENDDGTLAPIHISVVNFLPGTLPFRYPEGIGGFRLTRKGAFVIKDMHYGPSATPTTDQSSLNLFFGASEGHRPVYDIVFGTSGSSPVVPRLIIPPDSIKTFTTSARIPDAISVLTVIPHMHLLGRSFVAYAVTPTKDTIPLIRIPQWNFRWQYSYTFPKIVKIPAGSVIHATGVYDNTEANPDNPFSPPREVRDHSGSMRTTDEMFQLILQYMRYQLGDEDIQLDRNASAAGSQ